MTTHEENKMTTYQKDGSYDMAQKNIGAISTHRRLWTAVLAVMSKILAVAAPGVAVAADLPAWPKTWQVFGPIPPTVTAVLDEKTLATIPAELEIAGKKYPARTVEAKEGVIDFKQQFSLNADAADTGAWIFAPIKVENDITFGAGAGADFWMEWYVNGRKVCDTMMYGNRTNKYSPSNFRFEVPLKKGDNVVACRILSGSLGFRVVSGEPTKAPPPSSPIEIGGDTQQRLNMELPDGGQKPSPGVQNIQILRTNRNQSEGADGDGWTYAHHQDLAAWKGRLYAAWTMSPKDEGGVSPEIVVYATSTDGFRWSAPADLFPRELASASRFYFYRATNGRMLAFCPGPVGGAAKKRCLLVREITPDHRLGEVFALINPHPGQTPSFETAADAGFVAACREAAGNNLLLEQSDFGQWLGARRMQWHEDPDPGDATRRVGGGYPFGKAFCFYHRQDGTLVGLCKVGWVTLSNDAGKTWSRPEQPPTLLAGSAKIWGQKTGDGRYALVYTPDLYRTKRYPLVIVSGNDGRKFHDLRVVHGEAPPLRYPGKYKDLGAQYMRGLAEWADDGTVADTKQAMWIVYSVHKEDIWVARVPLPVKSDETMFPVDDFTNTTPGGVVPGWNIYSPKWAPVTIVENGGKRSLELRDGDPHDYARAMRVFPETGKVRVEMELVPAQTNARLEIDLCDVAGRRPLRVMLTETGTIQAADAKVLTDLGKYEAGTKLSLVLTADTVAGRCRVQVNGGATRELAVAETDAKILQRLSLRTGPWRGLATEAGVDPATDVPLPTPAIFRIQRVAISGGGND